MLNIERNIPTMGWTNWKRYCPDLQEVKRRNVNDKSPLMKRVMKSSQFALSESQLVVVVTLMKNLIQNEEFES
jgi:Cys-tRNA synthase (O-phospho-L-seryl-tRNA:Cys-tRNA synthase)